MSLLLLLRGAGGRRRGSLVHQPLDVIPAPEIDHETERGAADQGQTHEEEDAHDGGLVGVAGGPAVLATAGAGRVAVGGLVPHVAVAVAEAVAEAVSVAVVRARVGPDCERADGDAALVDAEGAVAASRALGGQSGIHVVEAEVDEGGAAGDDLPAGVDEAVTEYGHRLHAEFEAFAEVGAVEHAALHVNVGAADEAAVEAGVSAVAMSGAFAVLGVALVVRSFS